MICRFLTVAAVAIAATLANTSESRAAFTVSINSTFTASDNDGVFDTDSSLGVITIDQIVAGYRIQLTSTRTDLGFGGVNVLNEALIVTATSQAVSPLSVTTFADGFSFPGMVAGSPVTLTNAASDSQFNIGVANATSTLAPTTPPGSGTTAPVTLTAPGAQGSSTSRVVVSGNPFSLSNTLVINGLLGAGNPQFNGTVTTTAALLAPTPAPAGLLLAAFGIPAFGLLRRFGRKVDATVAV